MNKFKQYIDHAKLDFKQYQYDGVEWCMKNENIRNGGILADEMGLGKTITMIGLMLVNPLKSTLIVLPPALIEQWNSQLIRTTGHTAIIYRGANKKKITLEQLKSARIVIASYAAISITKKQPSTMLHMVNWDRVLFDEAHHLRNKKTSCYFGASSLTAKVHWLITGTPIQNRKKDLLNICAVMGVYEEDIQIIAQNYILRRTKKEVGINIPNIIAHHQQIDWSGDVEYNMSEYIHSELEMSYYTTSESRELYQHLFDSDTKYIVKLMRARQMCSYPKMFDSTINSSSKLDAVVSNILDNKGNGNGKLVFCQFRAEIDELSKRLVDGGISTVATFDGRTSVAKRRAILAANNEVIVLQIQTGCEGLNLQDNYSEIYFVSPHWNPAVEDQAVARCHRIGQTKEVKVNRFSMGGFSMGGFSMGGFSNGLGLDTSISHSIDNYISTVQEGKRLLHHCTFE